MYNVYYGCMYQGATGAGGPPCILKVCRPRPNVKVTKFRFCLGLYTFQIGNPLTIVSQNSERGFSVRFSLEIYCMETTLLLRQRILSFYSILVIVQRFFFVKLRFSKRATKMWRNFPQGLDIIKQLPNLENDCAEFCGLLRIYQLYLL